MEKKRRERKSARIERPDMSAANAVAAVARRAGKVKFDNRILERKVLENAGILQSALTQIEDLKKRISVLEAALKEEISE